MDNEVIGIEVKKVSKRLATTQALRDLSLHFEPGLMHGLIGPEGAGKTTLFRCLVSLLKVDQGDILYLVNGTPRPFEEVKNQVSYMPQQQSLYPDLSIAEHLDFFRALFQIPRMDYLQSRKELLQITRLEPFVDRPASQLSGGMYKKLGLMCSLLRSPRVLLLDEPTNGVDPISRREFWELLYDLSARNVLIIVATSYMDEAERCQVVHLMDAGRALHEGRPRDILQSMNARTFDEVYIRSQYE